MGKHIRLKGRVHTYARFSIYLGMLLALVDMAIFLLDYRAGAIVSAFTVLYIIQSVILYWYNKPVIMNELVSFATEYGQVQKQLLREMDLPYALLDDGGKVVWSNQAFDQLLQEGRPQEGRTSRSKPFRKNISQLLPELLADRMPKGERKSAELDLQFGGRDFRAQMRSISLGDMLQNSAMFVEPGYEGYLVALFLFDQTAYKLAIQEVFDESLTVGMIYLDNYEEALESIEEVRRSLLTALIDRKINKYIAAQDGICKKLEKDKYIVLLRRAALTALQEARFDILEDVKTVNMGNEIAVTLSIGVGLGGLNYAQNYEFARNAIDLALGRGGDQAVLKSPDKISYFGGKSQQVEKNTRVKARVKAHALRELISSKDRILVMGHERPDVDSFGAAVGIYRIALALRRKAHIVLDAPPAGIRPLLEALQARGGYEEDMIIRHEQALEWSEGNTALVVVDVNKPSITECPELLRRCKSIVVFDHHRQGEETIDNATLSYVEPFASSTCEMVSEILQYIQDNIRMRPEEADCMYSGIMIDTNNFLSKTGVRTFEAAAFLRRSGADVTRVRKLFREDAAEYKARADAVSQAEIYRQHYAISTCSAEDLPAPTVVGAQAANELLNIKGVKASFVLTYHQGKTFISARSIDEVNVQLIMERMGGGGHMSIAAAQMENMGLAEAIGALKTTIDIMLDEGQI